MRITFTNLIILIVVFLLVLALFAAAAQQGFFGDAFDGFFGPATNMGTGGTQTIRR